MEITEAKVIVTCPGRNFVTLKIMTDDGLVGLGDATLNGRELAVVSYLDDHLIPCLIGRDAHRIEDIWQYLYRGAYWRGGPVTAVDDTWERSPRVRSASSVKRTGVGVGAASRMPSIPALLQLR